MQAIRMGTQFIFYKTAGLDRELFDLNISTGILTFKTPPDLKIQPMQTETIPMPYGSGQ